MRVAVAFAGAALLLAALGIYGVVAYGITLRRRELGIRMALGAGRGEVIRLMIRGAISLVVPGLVVGLVLALAADRLLQRQLYGVSPYDAGVMSMAVLALCSSAVLASAFPAVRASSVSPTEALRAE